MRTASLRRDHSSWRWCTVRLTTFHTATNSPARRQSDPSATDSEIAVGAVQARQSASAGREQFRRAVRNFERSRSAARPPNESLSVHPRDLYDLAVGRDVVSRYGAALPARKVLHQPAGNIECLVDGDAGVPVHALDLALLVMHRFLDVLQRAVQRWFVADDDGGAARDCRFDAGREVASVVTMRCGISTRTRHPTMCV